MAFSTLTSFSESLGSGNAGSVSYQLSPDGTNWYYHNGSNWAAASGSGQTNSASDINSDIGSFHSEVSTGSLRIRAFLNSNGSQAVELESVNVQGTP